MAARKVSRTTTFRVLVTGANSGLGFATCCRIIDEFLLTRPCSHTLHLLFSTRDARKSEDTRARLSAHLGATIRRATASDAARFRLEGVSVDLLKLATVKALAEQLLRRGQRLDAVVLNAGIAGWSHIDWLKATWNICTDLVQATTYPTYMVADMGLRAKAQQQQQPSQPHTANAADDEPVLGQVFTANVFGHYLLVHWLSALLDSASRIVWVSSVSAVPASFDVDDLQGLRNPTAYEGSKRLTDLLVLTSELPSTAAYVHEFLPPPSPRPQMFVTHPGVVGTSIAGLNCFLGLFVAASFYLARWLGSPWHPVQAYKGAVSVAFAVLAPPPQFVEREARDGKGKWGSATDVFGAERVARTEVEGWGFNGRVAEVPNGSIAGAAGRFRGHQPTTRERREEFEEMGRRVWREMEALRSEWERRLGPLEV